MNCLKTCKPNDDGLSSPVDKLNPSSPYQLPSCFRLVASQFFFLLLLQPRTSIITSQSIIESVYHRHSNLTTYYYLPGPYQTAQRIKGANNDTHHNYLKNSKYVNPT